MPNGIFLLDTEYTFQEAMRLLEQAISSINDRNADEVFSIVDVLCLLRSVNEYVPGEFELQRAHSHYYRIVYKSADEVLERFKERWEGFVA